MPNKKSWIRPELIIIKRQANLSVLGFCKYISAAGPGVAGCSKYQSFSGCAAPSCTGGLSPRCGGLPSGDCGTPGYSYSCVCACKEFQISS